MGDHIFNFHPYAQTQQDFRNATPKFNPRWTADGSQIVFAIGRGTDQPIDGRVYVVAANGSSLTPITVGTGDYVIDHSPDIAPDGSQIVLSSYRVLRGSSGDFGDFERHFELTTSTLDGADQKRVTSNSGYDFSPTWSPDGKRLAFVRDQCPSPSASFKLSIWVMDTDGSRARMIAHTHGRRPISHLNRILGYRGDLSWSPNGELLSYSVIEHEHERFVAHYILEVNGRDLTRIHAEPANHNPIGAHAWSPDGSEIAFVSANDGNLVLLAVTGDGSSLRVITDPGITDPNKWMTAETLEWSPDGASILFSVNAGGSAGLYVVDATGGEPELISSGRYASWSPDGSRIAIVMPDSLEGVLVTMNPRGSDMNTLVRRTSDETVSQPRGNTGGLTPEPDVLRAVSADFGIRGGDVVECHGAADGLGPRYGPGLAADCVALLQVRDKLGGSTILNWTADTDLVDWEGVVISGTPARVVGLSLPARGLSGIIPAEIGVLSSMKVLNLSDNGLAGPIPPELARLSNLEELNLRGTNLFGPIPRELGELQRLRVLMLSAVSLTGPIPAEIGKLTNLRKLLIQSRSLSGTIPPELGNLLQLEELTLGSILTGNIPGELGKLSRLRVLDLSNNRHNPPGGLAGVETPTGLSGQIPKELGKLSKLERLILDDNRLTDTIPTELGHLASLDELDLSFNDLTGSVPPEFANLTSLRVLRLRNHRLDLSIPRICWTG